MQAPPAAVVTKLRSLLDDARTPQERIVEVAAGAGPDGAAALARAAKGSKRREERRVRVLFALGDRAAHRDADEAVRAILRGPPSELRDAAAQLAAFDPARLRFAPELRAIARDAADPSWDSAVHALGALRDPEAVAVILEHARGVETSFRVLESLVGFRDPRARQVFEAMLAHGDAAMRTFALWGLAALGHETPAAKLVTLLLREPSQSIRAAQALADVYGWPFDWSTAIVGPTRARCDARFTPEHLERCLRTFDRGELDLD